MADTLFDGFSDYTYFQSGDILIAQRGAGGINVPVDALMFKDANSIFNTLGRSMNLSADGDYLGIGAYFASGQWRNSVASQGGAAIRNVSGRLAILTGSNPGAAGSAFTDMAERFTVLANGNVGIGTSAPGTILDIQGSTSGTSRINVLRTGGSGVGAQLLSTGSVGGVAATNGGGFSIFTSDADRVRVDESGRVGVGNTSPQQRLTVDNGANAVSAASVGLEAKASLFLQNSGGTPANGAIYNAIGFSGINTTRRRAMIAAYQDGADGDPTGLAFYTYASTVTGSDAVDLRLQLAANGVISPGSDNAQSLGWSSGRWSVVYAATGTINTSDEREKKWRGAANKKEIVAAKEMISELGFFQWIEAVDEKGPRRARYHYGVRAQRVWAIMAKHGLVDPISEDGRPGKTRYAFLCFDEWEDEFEDETETVAVTKQREVTRELKGLFDALGNPATVTEMEDYEEDETVKTGRKLLVRAAGNRYGVRTDQLTLFLMAGQEAHIAEQAARQAALDARLSALEAKAA